MSRKWFREEIVLSLWLNVDSDSEDATAWIAVYADDVLIKDFCALFSEIPVFPTVTAKVTFQEFEWKQAIDSHLFVIPDNYHEDPKHFRDL